MKRNMILKLFNILYLITKTGLTLYSESLCGLSDKRQEEKDFLLGGALSAIDALVKELSLYKKITNISKSSI